MKEALHTLVAHDIGGLVVLDETGAPVGVISERDIMRAAARADDFLEQRVADVMTRDPVTGSPDDELKAVLETMTVGRFRHLPVMDGDALIGLVSMGDVIKCLLHCYEGEIHTLQHRVMEP